HAALGGNATGGRKASALVVRREVLATYQKLCNAAGLKLQVLTPRLVGVAACVRQVIGKTVVTPPPEPPDGVIAVVVVGDKTAELCVMREGAFLLTRSLATGTDLAGAIKRTLAVHAGQMPQFPVAAVYLAGKGAGELRERLHDMIETPVHTFDPFAGSEARELPSGNRGTFAGTVGLLWARVSGQQLPINFVAPRQPQPPANPHVRLYRVAAVSLVLVVLGMVGLGPLAAGMYNGRSKELEIERTETGKDLDVDGERAKRLKELDALEVPVWADELYELTALIDVSALRVTAVALEPLARTATSKSAGRITI